MKNAILIAGPTASGKSALALQLAHWLISYGERCGQRRGAQIINADSMQVYDVLKVVTARPDEAEMEGITHHLYGHVHPSKPYNVAEWLGDVEPILSRIQLDGDIPIFVGGTGLYFNALLNGLSKVPPVDPEIRKALRQRADVDYLALRKQLQEIDREGALKISKGDRQRTLRALEVKLSSGKPLSWWQNQSAAQPLLRIDECIGIVIDPDRPVLRNRIAQRFEKMVEEGALTEVERLLELNIAEGNPAMRAIGVKELACFIEQKEDLEKAIELAVVATRQYAKRQSTWFRNQFDERWLRIKNLSVDPQILLKEF